MKRLVRKVLKVFGYDLSRIRNRQFVISGIRYEVCPCSVGHTPQGEMTANGAVRMIQERRLKDLAVLDMCCGVGIIGLTMFSKLREEGIIKELVFSDINIFNLNSLHRTLAINNLGPLTDGHVRSYLSDGLKHVPTDEKFDLIVSNPPHLLGSSFSDDDRPLSPSRLGTYDPAWDFHRSFYSRCHDHLTERGEIWFLENGSVSSEKDFLPFIEGNRQLKYDRRIEEPLDPGFYWMITKKA